MKTRNGFVSNSSSSSFILVYNKSNVIKDLNEIVNYVKSNPDTLPIFCGIDLGDGQDIFTLTSEEESLIRKFPDRFIAKNTLGNIALYTNNAKMIRSFKDYGSAGELDMSDVERPDITNEELNIYMKYIYKDKDAIPKEIMEKVKKLEYYDAIYDERLKRFLHKKDKEHINKTKNEIIEESNCKNEDLSAKELDVDCASTEETIEFAERYMTNECCAYSNDFILKSQDDYDRPYLLKYDDLISDKHLILEYLAKSDNISDCLVFWSNPVFNFVEKYEDDFTIDFYRIGEQELEILKQKLKTSAKEIYLATNADIVTNDSGILKESFKYKLGYGNPVLIETGTDLIDFEKRF